MGCNYKIDIVRKKQSKERSYFVIHIYYDHFIYHHIHRCCGCS